MYIAKEQQAHRYRKQTSGHQWGEGSGGHVRSMRFKNISCYV